MAISYAFGSASCRNRRSDKAKPYRLGSCRSRRVLPAMAAAMLRVFRRPLATMKNTIRGAYFAAALASAHASAGDASKFISPPPLQPDIVKLVGDISATRIEAYVRKLASFGTRNTLSAADDDKRGIGAARRWIKAELDRCNQENGRPMTVAFDEFLAPVSARIPKPTPVVNVVATLPGRDGASQDRIYVVSGHYDSMSGNVLDTNADAPGANDDASGTAVSIELACVMSRYRFDATLVFMAVAGEEQGLVGAAHWARTARAKNLNIAGMITNDIVGNTRGMNGERITNRLRLFADGIPAKKEQADEVLALLRTGGENDTPARQLARHIKAHAERYVPDFTVQIIYRRDRYLRGGDHIAFLDNGYAAVRFTEPIEHFTRQHQNVRVEDGVQYGDLPDFVDYDFTTKVARVNAAALAALALAPAAPADVELENLKLENDTTLRWKANGDADIAGYRIVWRDTTSPAWQWSKDVGSATRETIVGVSKDNVIFGVQAIDKAGNASVVSYPKPYRR
jgi:hypothetical protein